MMTHYIPPFTTTTNRQQMAACGAWVTAREHSTEPTCPTCSAYLLQDAEDDEATARALEAEFPEMKGKLVTR